MPAREIEVEGIEAFFIELKNHDGKRVFALFCGSLGADGQNWCSDCVAAEPVVNKCKSVLADGDVFIHCGVGDKTFWKDTKNAFRMDEQLKLKCVPTLLLWGSPKRLQEEECAREDMVQMLFED